MTLLQRFEISTPVPSVKWQGLLYRTFHRATGRRIVVQDADGKTLFDTDAQYDLGNATNRLDLWLDEQFQKAGQLTYA